MGNKTSKTNDIIDNYFLDIFNKNQKIDINFFPGTILLKIFNYCFDGSLPSNDYFSISLVCKIWRDYSLDSVKKIKLVPEKLENLLIPYGKTSVLDNAFLSIQNIIRCGSSLKSIDFSNGEFNYIRMKLITDALTINQTISELTFQFCYLDSNFIEMLSECLKNNKTIQHLDLSNNNITHQGALCLAKSLQNNKSILSIDLSHNEIGNQGALAISEILISNKSSIKVNLSQNMIGGQGVIEIIKASNKQMKSDSFKTSYIYKSGFKLLTENGNCSIIKSQ